ncbi:hypothetical protein SLA2020_214210 [Shorea laevis]
MRRELYGVFKATSDGELNIVSKAYGSSGRLFPAQVKATTIWNCHPLSEDEFCHAIGENYFARNKFNFGLSYAQVYKLLSLFNSRKVHLEPQSCIKNEVGERDFMSSSKKAKVEKDEFCYTLKARKKLKMDIEVDAYSDKFLLAEDDSQFSASRNSYLTCKVAENLSCQHTYIEASCLQSLVAYMSSYSSTSEHGLGPHFNNTEKHVNSGEELKEKDISSRSLDGGVEDFIPLSSLSDDHGKEEFIPLLSPCEPDPTESKTLLGAHCLLNSQMHPSAVFEDQKNLFSYRNVLPFPNFNGDDFIRKNVAQPLAASVLDSSSDGNNHHRPMKSLYSDSPEKRNSVFSRLKFTSEAWDKQYKNKANESVCKVRTEEGCNTEYYRSVHEIMEELLERHGNGRKKGKIARSFEKEYKDNAKERRNVFLHLRS